jgi:hypothetical protein
MAVAARSARPNWWTRIQAGKPLALGIDIVFAERDRYSPSYWPPAIPVA